MNDSHRLTDPSDLRKYRHELPNLIDDMGLSPFAYRLYGHIKRRCGASEGGECYEGTRKMAEVCKMSAGMVFKAKRELEEAGLIKIVPGNAKTNTADTITIVDVWAENFRRYQTCSQDEQGIPKPVHDTNRPVHESAQTCSQDEHKKEPVEEITSTTTDAGARDDDPGYPFTNDAVRLYVEKMKPDPGLSINQAELIATEVTDMPTWRRVVVMFVGNDSRGRDGTGRKVGNALDRYRKELDASHAAKQEQSSVVRGNFQRPNVSARTERQDRAAEALIVGAAQRLARAGRVRGGGEPVDS